jgi:predicted MFS family arabinose efflux permease
VTQAVVYTVFPLLANERGLRHAAIGFPTPSAVSSSPPSPSRSCPHAESRPAVLAIVAVFGAVSGTAGVAIGVALTHAAPPTVRGVVMGGYSMSLYLGLALGSLALGPVIARHGYVIGFSLGAAAGAVGAVIAAALWVRAQRLARRSRRGRT